LAWTRVRTDLVMAEDGSLSGRLQTEAGGAYAVALREIADGLGPMTDQLKRLGTPGRGSFSYEPPMALDTDNYRIEAKFLLEDGLADQPDHRLALPIGPAVMVRPGGFLVSDIAGQHGGHVCYAGRQEEEIHLHLPDRFTQADLPRDISVVAGFAQYHATWRREDHEVIVQRAFTVQSPRPLCTEPEYEAMKPALRAARLDQHTRLALQDVSPPIATTTGPRIAMLPSRPEWRDISARTVVGVSPRSARHPH
jgi:hypothetical protein